MTHQVNEEIFPTQSNPEDQIADLGFKSNAERGKMQQKYVDLRGPVAGFRCAPLQGGGCVNQTNYHPVLQTVRIPLADFGNVDLTKVRGVRFSFNNTSSGSINLANIRFTKGQ